MIDVNPNAPTSAKDVQRAAIINRLELKIVSLYSTRRAAEVAFHRVYNRSALLKVVHVDEDMYQRAVMGLERAMKQ